MSPPSSPKPNPWRLLLGFALAPLVPAVVFCYFQWELGAIALVLIYGCYPAAIVLGIPMYLLLRNRVRPRLVTIMLVGGVIAMLPWLVLFLLPQSESTQGQVGDCITTINGRMTWCGFVGSAKFLAEIFPYGALGGLVFWLCVVWRVPQRTVPSSVTN